MSQGKKRVLVGYGVDIDAIAGWLGSYQGQDSGNDISRGLERLPARSTGTDCPRLLCWDAWNATHLENV